MITGDAMIAHYRLDIGCYAADYQQARTLFLEACRINNGELNSFMHPLSSRSEVLATDVYWLGSSTAENVLVLSSATHGVEGYCGSAAQVQFLRTCPELPENTAVLLIHALNPYGFMFGRRCNEDNIDLNRNFADFSTTVPVNSGYREIAGYLMPEHWEQLVSGEQALQEYCQKHGRYDYEQAVCGGQYEYPDGLFYGGQAPSWSRQLVEKLLSEFDLQNRRRLVVVDIHTGLGPYGYGEIICDHPAGSIASHWAKQWFGDSVTEPECGTSSSGLKFGLLDYAWHPVIADNGCFVTLEFGTYSVDQMFSALRMENYAHHKPVTNHQKQQSKQCLKDFFYPAKRDWQEMTLFRSAQVIQQALAGISA